MTHTREDLRYFVPYVCRFICCERPVCFVLTIERACPALCADESTAHLRLLTTAASAQQVEAILQPILKR